MSGAPLLAVIDHGAGNLVSIARGLEQAGARVRLAGRPGDMSGADGVVLPGVGATGAAMAQLDAAGLVEPLRGWEGPLLGICVGMQLLFEDSEENAGSCLGVLAGSVRRLRYAPRLPHIGWNDLVVRRPDPLLDGMPGQPLLYFVHSYAPVPADPEIVVAETEYGRPLVAMVRAGRVSGVQFHPERSGSNGLRLLANFVAECTDFGVTNLRMAEPSDAKILWGAG